MLAERQIDEHLLEHHSGVARNYYTRLRADNRNNSQSEQPLLPWHELLDETNIFPIENENIQGLMQNCANYMSPNEIAMVHAAASMALWAHRHQYRDSSEPYFNHLAKIARILSSEEYQMDGVTVASALLHDAIEDTSLRGDEIRRNISGEVADTVSGLTKAEWRKVGSKHEAAEVTRKKIINSLLTNPRVAIIKFFDRLDFLETLDTYRGSRASVTRHISETLTVYAPLAKRFGMFDVGNQLERLCLMRSGKLQKQFVVKADELAKEAVTDDYESEVEDDVTEMLKDTTLEVYTRKPTASGMSRRMSDLRLPEKKDLYLHVGIIMNDVAPKVWDKKANSVYYDFLRSGMYEVVDPPVDLFPQLAQSGLTDSLIFSARRKKDGMLCIVHIYPYQAYVLEQASLVNLYMQPPYITGVLSPKSPDEILRRRQSAEEKHRNMIDVYRRITENGHSEEAADLLRSADLVKFLEPRAPLGMDYIIGIDDSGRETPWPVKKGETVFGYASGISPGRWPWAYQASVNDEFSAWDRQLQASDRIHVVYGQAGSEERWDPLWIHLTDDENVRSRIRKEVDRIAGKEIVEDKQILLGQYQEGSASSGGSASEDTWRKIIAENGKDAEIIREQRRRKLVQHVHRNRMQIVPDLNISDHELANSILERQSVGREMYFRILDAGWRRIEKLSQNHLHAVTLDSASDVISRWQYGMTQNEFLYRLGLGRVPEPILEKVTEKLKVARGRVSGIEVIFRRDRPGLIESTAASIRAGGLPNIIFQETHTRGSQGPAFISVKFDGIQTDPRRMLAAINEDIGLRDLGMVGVKLI